MIEINENLLENIKKDHKVRRTISRKSFYLFFVIYFSHYVKYTFADFHKEIINTVQEDTSKFVCIVAFRGSGKSTLVTTASSIWSILGAKEKKFVLIISQTITQVKTHMNNLKSELENNTLLKNDLGPFKEDRNEWNSYSIFFSNINARITISSVEQSIRGLRHGSTRPDLIILDDVEDMQSVKTIDSREKLFTWFTSEIIPLGDLNTQIYIVGNIIHKDSLISKIKEEIQNERINGSYFEYPLIDENGNCLWPEKFKNKSSIEDLRKTLLSKEAWEREYLLKTTHYGNSPISSDMINYYNEIPEDRKKYSEILIGVDPAVSEKTRADFSAIVVGLVIREKTINKKEIYTMYILPKIYNIKKEVPDLLDLIKNIIKENYQISYNLTVLVESTSFQEAIVQILHREGFSNCEGCKSNEDKRTRISSVSYKIKFGQILFPREGAEDLINQLVGFGSEKHDDLADAFTLIAKKFDTAPPFIGIA